MKFLLSILLIALLSAAAEHFFPWWSVVVISFLVSLFITQRPGWAFLMGFCGIGLFWLVAALLADVANQHILSARMAVLFHLPGPGLFIAITVLIGGLVGGLSAWVAALLRPKNMLP